MSITQTCSLSVNDLKSIAAKACMRIYDRHDDIESAPESARMAWLCGKDLREHFPANKQVTD